MICFLLPVAKWRIENKYFAYEGVWQLDSVNSAGFYIHA